MTFSERYIKKPAKTAREIVGLVVAMFGIIEFLSGFVSFINELEQMEKLTISDSPKRVIAHALS